MPVDMSVPNSIMQSYFTGLADRRQREQHQAQIQQEQARLAAQQQEFAETQKRLMSEHSDVTKHNEALLKVRQAELDQTAAQLKQENALNNYRSYRQALEDIHTGVRKPNTKDYEDDVTGLPVTFPSDTPVGDGTGRVINAREIGPTAEAILRRTEAARQANALKLMEGRTDSSEEVQKLRNQGALDRASFMAIAKTFAGGGVMTPAQKYRVTKELVSMMDEPNKGQEKKLYDQIDVARGINAPYYNKMYKVYDEGGQKNEKLIGQGHNHSDINLVLTYLQATLPSTRVTNFEYLKSATADSDINELGKRARKLLVSGNELTHEVRRLLMDEIQKAYAMKAGSFYQRIEAKEAEAMRFAAVNGLDYDEAKSLVEKNFAKVKAKIAANMPREYNNGVVPMPDTAATTPTTPTANLGEGRTAVPIIPRRR